MPSIDLFWIYLIGILLVFLPAFGLAKLFKMAGQPAWKAYVPFYNTYIMQKIADRPVHWVYWQLVPVMGWFVTMGIFVEFSKVFAKYSLANHVGASLFAPLYFPYIANKSDTSFIGPEPVKLYKKPVWREWIDAGAFAVVAATLIRTFVFEAYTIPTGSMEKTLLVKDFLFVSKISYGARVPNTPLSFPFVHNYMPFINTKSYSTAIQLPYSRWFTRYPKRGDVVVFNFPEGDTVIHHPEYESAKPYYNIKQHADAGNVDAKMILEDKSNFPVVAHPVDKTDNYIKRCVGIAGDTLRVIENEVYISGQKSPLPPHGQVYYTVTFNVPQIDQDLLKSEYNLEYEKGDYSPTQAPNEYTMLLTFEAREKMLKNKLASKIVPALLETGAGLFPRSQDSLYTTWTNNNYGPLWIPKRGAKIILTPQNLPLYHRAITNYEHSTLTFENGKMVINGKATNEYTFKYNYYWMMGDNRQGSQDSRYWGFVPETHIVGKAWMIWFSWENGPRWKRLFNFIK